MVCLGEPEFDFWVEQFFIRLYLPPTELQKIGELRKKNVPIKSDFQEVFLYVNSLPMEREIEFSIDLVPRTGVPHFYSFLLVFVTGIEWTGN